MVARCLKPNFQIVGVWPFRLEGLWFRYATLQNFIPSFPWIVPGWRAGAKSKGSTFAIWQPYSQSIILEEKAVRPNTDGAPHISLRRRLWRARRRPSGSTRSTARSSLRKSKSSGRRQEEGREGGGTLAIHFKGHRIRHNLLSQFHFITHLLMPHKGQGLVLMSLCPLQEMYYVYSG